MVFWCRNTKLIENDQNLKFCFYVFLKNTKRNISPRAHGNNFGRRGIAINYFGIKTKTCVKLLKAKKSCKKGKSIEKSKNKTHTLSINNLTSYCKIKPRVENLDSRHHH